MSKNNNHKFLAISIVLNLIIFQLSYGFQIIIPTNINWLMTVYHDWGQHYLGWAYFRAEPWHFPIGSIENYNFPAGTNVGFTDSIPLLAIIFKLFSFLLSDTFQYFGIWFLSCHLLLGYFTFKLLNLFTKNYILIVVAVLLVSYNPIILYRALHPALCAQWLLVASMYFYLRNTSKENVHKINKKQLFILVLSALINPYLFLMVFGFAVILPFKNYYFDKLISLKQVFLYIFSGLFIVFVSWLLVGMVSFSTTKTMEVQNSYGLYGFNLNSFYNSSGWSSFFQALKTYSPRQYEGFSYLGLGIFILIIISSIYLIYIVSKKSLHIKKYYKLFPFFLLIFIATIFAITNKVTINNTLLFDYYLPEIILKIGNVFRASGRFIWILFYAILFYFLWILIKSKIPEKAKILLMILICSIQFYDTKLLLSKNLQPGDYKVLPLNEDKWTEISSNFQKIITYPLYNNSLLYNSDYQDWCYIALKNKLPITNGYVARESGTKNLMYQQQFQEEIANAIINENDLIITTPKYLSDFNSLIYKSKIDIRYLDGFYYLFSKNNKNMKKFPFSKSELNKVDSITKELKSSYKITSINKPIIQENKVQFNLEKITNSNKIMNIQGWAFLKSKPTKNDSVFLALTNENNTYLLKTSTVERPDVSDYFKNNNLSNSGFKITIMTENMIAGNYSVLIGIKSLNKLYFQSANQPIIEINKEINPVILKKLPIHSDSITYNIEDSKLLSNNLIVSGWAFLPKKTSQNNLIFITLEKNKVIYSLNVLNVERPDVTSHFNQNVNYDNAGFKLILDKQKIEKGKYTIGIIIESDNKKSFFTRTNQTILID